MCGCLPTSAKRFFEQVGARYHRSGGYRGADGDRDDRGRQRAAGGRAGNRQTRLIRSLGRVFSLPFSRIQFTPDLMPADITGTNVLEKDEKGNAVYTFRPGPIFSATSCWRTKSTAPRRNPRARCGSHAGAYGDGGRQGLSHGGAVFRAGDAEPDEEGRAPTPAGGAGGPLRSRC